MSSVKELTLKELKAEYDMLLAWSSKYDCQRCYINKGKTFTPLTIDGINHLRGRYCESYSLVSSNKIKPVDIMIVGDAISGVEVGRQLMFAGGPQRILLDSLDNAEINTNRVYLDKVIRCTTKFKNFSGMSAAHRNKMIDKCKPYLMSEIERLKPKVIVAAGKFALRALIGINDDMENWRGRPIKYKNYNCYVVPTYSPAYVHRCRWELEDFENDLKLAKSLIDKPIKFSKPKCITVDTKAKMNGMVKELEASNTFVVDIETTGINVYEKDAGIVGIALSCDKNKGYFVPLQKYKFLDKLKGKPTVLKMWRGVDLKSLKKLLKSKRHIKVFHGGLFDKKWLNYNGFEVAWPVDDTMITNSVYDRALNKLGELAWVYTDFGGYDSNINVKQGAHLVDPKELAEYACKDAIATYRMHIELKKGVVGHHTEFIIKELLQLSYNLTIMEMEGCLIDKKVTKNLKRIYEIDLKKLDKKIQKVLGVEININSNPQLLAAMYGPGKMFARYTHINSTDKKKLEKLTRTLKNPVQLNVIKNIQEYRKIGKYISTYLKRFLTDTSDDGRIHPNFTIHVAITGRLSSKEPNLMNIPREGDIRNCFIAATGKKLVELDVSGGELRLAAEYSKDEKMLAVLNDPKGDIHAIIGQAAFKDKNGKDYLIEMFKDGELRNASKITSFSILYGKQVPSLAFDLNRSLVDTQRIYDLFFKGFPGLAEWIKHIQDFALEHGYIETLFGRRIKMVGWKSDFIGDIEFVKRISVNYPIQSGASDFLFLALNRVRKMIDKHKMPAVMLLTVYDSLLFEVERSFAKEFALIAKAEMEKSIIQIKHVKMYIDYKIGKSWGTIK